MAKKKTSSKVSASKANRKLSSWEKFKKREKLRKAGKPIPKSLQGKKRPSSKTFGGIDSGPISPRSNKNRK